MPREYQLKNSPIDPNRIKKICKQIVDEGIKDRSLALEAYKMFKTMVDDNPQDVAARSLMLDCLKLAQTSKQSTIKIVDCLIKLEATGGKGKDKGESSMFSQLDQLLD